MVFGLLLDSEMSRNSQINHMTKSINYVLYRLRYFKNVITPSPPKRLVSTLISPFFDYGTFAIGQIQHPKTEKIKIYITSRDLRPVENLNHVNDLINTASDEGFNFSEVSLIGAILAIAHFKSQAMGDHDIPDRVIAKSLPTIGPFLVKIFNESLTTGIFPPAWKISLLIAIEKSNISSSCFDFRPVALLCFLSKFL